MGGVLLEGCAGKDALGCCFAFLGAFLRSARSNASATLNELRAALQLQKTFRNFFFFFQEDKQESKT